MKKLLASMLISFLFAQLSFADVSSKIQSLLPRAQAGNVAAQYQLGYIYQHQQKDPQKSLYWYQKAADQGNAFAQALTGLMYMNGQGAVMNYKKARHYLKLSAEQGNEGGQNGMGLLYLSGFGVPKNPEIAKQWFEKSAAQGFAGGIFNLGQVYFYGDIGKPDIQKGMGLFIKAANLGYAFGQYRLGQIYASPRSGAYQNVPVAYMWIKLAAINGQPDTNHYSHIFPVIKKQDPYCIAQGQALIAQKYYQGKAGLQQSNTATFKWLQKAYQTDPLFTVALSLAKAYQAGIGTEKNSQKAFDLTKQAAQKPYAPAQQYLANFYMNGIATQKDLVKAYAWLLLAQYTFDHPDAKFYAQYRPLCRPSPNGDALQSSQTVQSQLDQLRSEISSAQLAKAKTLFEALKQKQAVLKP